MAVFADPTGAVFAVWQAGRSIGSEIVNEPVSLTWNEVMTRDPAAASAFYTSLFGWGTETLTDGPMPYTLFMRGDEQVAGMIEMNDQWPDEAPPSWGVYFAVEDCDATVEKAKELGGSLVIGPMDIPPGRFASIVDPHGAFFSVIALSPQVAG
jgi:predicted enzyme related to lactoylglutathione lyase